MLHRTIVLTLFAAAAVTSPAIQAAQERANLQDILACWDQTFGYNGFRIESSDQRFYVSLSGSQLVKEGDFYVSNNIEQIHLDSGWSNPNHQYHVSFLLADCTLTPDAASLTCAKGDLMTNLYGESFYHTRKIDDLGTIRDLTSRFPVQRLELIASSDGLTLKKLHRLAGTGEIVTEALAILPYADEIPLSCDSGEQIIPRVAPALVSHLEQR